MDHIRRRIHSGDIIGGQGYSLKFIKDIYNVLEISKIIILVEISSNIFWFLSPAVFKNIVQCVETLLWNILLSRLKSSMI